MIKKILTICLISVACINSAFADLTNYIGASVGITANTVHKQGITSFRGMPFDVFLGYGGVIDPTLYMAGEIIGSVTTVVLANGQLKTTTSYGISILPGLMLTNQALVFLRFGVLRARFSTISTNSTGGEAGVGLQIGVMPSVDLRGEYDYIAYRSISRNGVSGSPRSDQFNLGLMYKFG